MTVVDCSALVDALSGVPGADTLRARLSAGDLHAPTLLDYEVVSAVRGLALAGRLSSTRAQDLLSDFDDMTIERWPSAAALRTRALQLRNNVSAYDAAYVALAESLDCPLVTRDARLAGTGGHAVKIVVL